jgi:hypothetical protein
MEPQNTQQDMTPEEAKASLGIATHLQSQLLPQDTSQMPENAQGQGEQPQIDPQTMMQEMMSQMQDMHKEMMGEMKKEMKGMMKTEIKKLLEEDDTNEDESF